MSVEIATACTHCGAPMHLTVDHNLSWKVHERGADPRLFLPHIDWPHFYGNNIIRDY